MNKLQSLKKVKTGSKLPWLYKNCRKTSTFILKPSCWFCAIQEHSTRKVSGRLKAFAKKIQSGYVVKKFDQIHSKLVHSKSIAMLSESGKRLCCEHCLKWRGDSFVANQIRISVGSACGVK